MFLSTQFAQQAASIPLTFRCLQATHKASGKVLDNTCDLKLTPDSWWYLQHRAQGKYCTAEESAVLSEDDLSRLKTLVSDMFRWHRVDLMYCPPKPALADPGITRNDVQFIVSQIEWRVFRANVLVHAQYYASGRLRQHVLVLMGCEFTDEVLASEDVCHGVYEPMGCRPADPFTDCVALGGHGQGQGPDGSRVVVQQEDSLLYVDLPGPPLPSTVSHGRVSTLIERYKQLRTTDAGFKARGGVTAT